jgi:hypothetical protein
VALVEPVALRLPPMLCTPTDFPGPAVPYAVAPTIVVVFVVAPSIVVTSTTTFTTRSSTGTLVVGGTKLALMGSRTFEASPAIP